ncbi:hypothetical protein GGR51DRAFT_543135 [Nemania sp. FL0031]|nr:hypothetical protein GGR51DRAFT_543135 [Nemania sp. FL0031]
MDALPASLSEVAEVFGQFNQCLAFQSWNHHDKPNSSESVVSLQSPHITMRLDNDHDVFTLLDQVETSQPDVCILAFTSRNPKENGKLPLPISQRLFKVAIEKFDTSPAYLSALETDLATYTGTVPLSRGSKREWENARFVIQQNRAYSTFSIALTFNVNTGKIRALIFGAESGLLTRLFEHLGYVSTRPFWPMLIPILAMELQAHWFSRTLMKCQDNIHSIEASTGMRQFNYSHEKREPTPPDWKTLDLIAITRDLSSFLSRIAFLEMQAETSAYLMQQIAETTALITKTSALDESSIDSLYKVSPRLENVRNLYLGLASRCRYLTKRTNAQAQTVYCLIASQDHVANMDIAGASRDIALMTARDGATMRVIAAVTILFLPATFVATLFSTSFFNFQDTSGPRISGWIWIYVLVTAVLTVAVQSVWAVISKRKAGKITQNLPV